MGATRNFLAALTALTTATFALGALDAAVSAGTPPMQHLATVTEHPVRAGGRHQTKPIPPAPEVPTYPSSVCDTITPGMPTLTPAVLPAAFHKVGVSVEGRPIWAEYWGPTAPARTVIVIAGIHGNECSPQLLIEHVRNHPPTTYGIWLIPTLNPDGHANYTRRNATGIDLNADGQHRAAPETAALFEFVAAVQPVLTVHVHSPNGFVGWHPNSAMNAEVSTAISEHIAATTTMTRAFAGERSGSNWFLWQGLQQVAANSETLLVELNPISPLEVPTATPRAATVSVDASRQQSAAVLATIRKTLA